MARFNQSARKSTKTINRAGGKAFEQSDKLKLASLLLTSFLKSQFYRTGKETQDELIDLVKKVDPLFAAKAAVYARNVFGMRSVSHVVAGELSGPLSGQEFAKRFYHKVAFRPDDVTEIISYVGVENITHAMRKGLRTALEGFDEYQVGKYKGSNKSFKLVDAVNILHAHTPAIEKLVKGTLKPAETWETKMSGAGKSEDVEKAKAVAWRELLAERKIGYLALVRNLRNIAQQAPELIPVACELLQDEKLIAKSKIFPFQYMTAYNEIEVLGERTLLSAITRAIDLSCKNVPEFKGKTLIAVDESGSMAWNRQVENISSLFAAILYKATDADLLTFNHSARYRVANPDDSTITIAKGLSFAGGGTDFGSIFSAIGKKKYDRIIILSDMQSWGTGYGDVNGSFNSYRQSVNPEVRLYTFDLAGMGDMQFPERNVFTVAGWSDKVFDVMGKLESGESLVEQIEKVVL